MRNRTRTAVTACLGTWAGVVGANGVEANLTLKVGIFLSLWCCYELATVACELQFCKGPWFLFSMSLAILCFFQYSPTDPPMAHTNHTT